MSMFTTGKLLESYWKGRFWYIVVGPGRDDWCMLRWDFSLLFPRLLKSKISLFFRDKILKRSNILIPPG
jgi:hypothetical protein